MSKLNSDTDPSRLFIEDKKTDPLAELDSAFHDAEANFKKQINKQTITQPTLDKNETIKEIYKSICKKHPEAMEIINSAEDINEIFLKASKKGQLGIMKLTLLLGAKDFNWALIKASQNGEIGAMKLAKAWGASPDYFDWALAESAKFGDTKSIALLKTWGATDFNRALIVASEYEQIEAMKLLRSFGATDITQALVVASKYGKQGAVALLNSWTTK